MELFLTFFYAFWLEVNAANIFNITTCLNSGGGNLAIGTIQVI
jgi:hypothetical protein